jgi:hypothetical protein
MHCLGIKVKGSTISNQIVNQISLAALGGMLVKKCSYIELPLSTAIK